MMMTTAPRLAVCFALAVLMGAGTAQAGRQLDLANPADALAAFRKVQCSTKDATPVVLLEKFKPLIRTLAFSTAPADQIGKDIVIVAPRTTLPVRDGGRPQARQGLSHGLAGADVLHRPQDRRGAEDVGQSLDRQDR